MGLDGKVLNLIPIYHSRYAELSYSIDSVINLQDVLRELCS
jgi:hypothetical protein